MEHSHLIHRDATSRATGSLLPAVEADEAPVRRRPLPGLARAAPSARTHPMNLDAGPLRRSILTAAEAKKGEEAPAAVLPATTNAKLGNYVKDLYKGIKLTPRIGDGSAADAIRYELANPGKKVGGRGHVQKGEEYSRGLKKWLKNNPRASEGDRTVAQTIIDDLASALGGK